MEPGKEIPEPIYIPESISHNLKLLHKSRIFLSIIGGIVSGILGFNGLIGFLIFLIYGAIGTALFTVKLGSSIDLFFRTYGTVLASWKTGFMEYLLCWV